MLLDVFEAVLGNSFWSDTDSGNKAFNLLRTCNGVSVLVTLLYCSVGDR
jgi:hypothetical protein